MLLLGAVATIHFAGAQLGVIGSLAELQHPKLVSDASWIRELEDDPTSHGYGIYGFLEGSNSERVRELALQHVKSSDPYLWLNAATFLASINHDEAVPYLIKSLQHTAHRPAAERAASLRRITGQPFGDDFGAWCDWYMTQGAEVAPDWTTSLGHSPKWANP